MSFQAISPDGLPIDPQVISYASEEAAREAVMAWCQRYARQGYYAAVGGRIPLFELPARCTISPIRNEGRTSVTAGELLDILQRAHGVMAAEGDDFTDAHADLIGEIHDVWQLLRREIEGSNAGCGHDVVIIGADYTDETLTAEVARILRDGCGFSEATSENTGGWIYCVIIPAGTRGTWYWGMANETWGGNLMTDDGEELRTLGTTVPSTCQDPRVIALAIERAFRTMKGQP